MFDKILIANRGEIAVRIIRAAREMGISTVAVFSEADREALHTQLADEAVCIGPAKASDSYLNVQNIINAAVLTKAQAIHPGFGFLAENSVFASMCAECNIKFIGPEPTTIALLGDKANARALMKSSGIPIIPGSDGAVTVELAMREAADIGYPLMIKAAAGGGGRGIRLVNEEAGLSAAIEAAKKEGMLFFGDDSIYIEKVMIDARHIEVQIIGDEYGNIIHLGERDCSMQRRNQKMLEEAPSVSMPQSIRERMCETAVKAAKAANYRNAGTVEFLLDSNGGFCFMEMNTRIQVEHPVTEMVTGIDIVKTQIRIAQGEPLDIKQEDVKVSGHAIECRVNAETPEKNFQPSCGEIKYLLMPGGGTGLRVDSAIYAGYVVSPFYDSMLAKVITHGVDRDEAIMKMKRALYEFVIEGIDTNIDFLLKLLNDPGFVAGGYNTSFMNTTRITGG